MTLMLHGHGRAYPGRRWLSEYVLLPTPNSILRSSSRIQAARSGGCNGIKWSSSETHNRVRWGRPPTVCCSPFASQGPRTTINHIDSCALIVIHRGVCTTNLTHELEAPGRLEEQGTEAWRFIRRLVGIDGSTSTVIRIRILVMQLVHRNSQEPKPKPILAFIHLDE